MQNGYMGFFVVNTSLDNDAEYQSLLYAEIMQKFSMGNSHTVYQGEPLAVESGNRHTKIIILHTADFVYIVMHYKLILIVFFIN